MFSIIFDEVNYGGTLLTPIGSFRWGSHARTLGYINFCLDVLSMSMCLTHVRCEYLSLYMGMYGSSFTLGWGWCRDGFVWVDRITCHYTIGIRSFALSMTVPDRWAMPVHLEDIKF